MSATLPPARPATKRSTTSATIAGSCGASSFATSPELPREDPEADRGDQGERRHRQERQALPDLGGKLRLHRALLLSVLVFCPWGLCPWLPLVVPWWLTDRSV